jgi:ribosomal-protein-alanine N-acetyltransferase
MYRTCILTIRKFVADDLASLTDLFSSSEAMRFIGPRRAMTLAETERWLNQQMVAQESGITRYAVSLKDTDELIGVCGFQEIDSVWDFGYYFRPAFWVQGFATEACSHLLDHADAILGGEDYIVFVAEDNASSHMMMERCGWCKDQKIRKDNELGYYYTKAQQVGAADAVYVATGL